MKDIQLCGVEYPLLDIIYRGVKENLITELGFKKRDVIAVDTETRARIIAAVKNLEPVYVPGGAAANTLSAFAGLGGSTAFIARCGQDHFGEIMMADFKQSGIITDGFILCDEPSGICIILVTEDAERTMFPSVEAGLRLRPEMLPEDLFRRSEWIFSQAYMLPYSSDLRITLDRTIELVKKHDCRLAFSLSAPGLVKAEINKIKEILPHVDLCFANEFEATELTGHTDPEQCAREIAKVCAHVVVTAGAQGVWIVENSEMLHVPAIACDPVDLTGAGDMFAGAYLFALTQGLDKKRAARAANYMAMRVICSVAARLSGDLKAEWQKALQA